MLFGLLTACAHQKKATGGIDPVVQNAVPLGLIGNVNEASDSVTIEQATLTGDLLQLDISYAGGCQKHEFSLIGSAAISKSLPPRRAIKLIHHNVGDKCKKRIHEKLYFNVEAFAYTKEKGSTIFLDLDGYRNSIEYIKQ